MIDPVEVRAALARHPSRILDLGALRPAAVLMPLFVKGGEGWVLLTRRTEDLPHHRGEIAFPGGASHDEDGDLEQTALRETEEEMGIRPADVTLLGRLDDIVSVHDYRVTPYVGTIPHPYPFQVNSAEVAEVIQAPLAVLSDPGRWRREDWRHRGRCHPVHFCTVDEHEVWGLTAAILLQFLQRLGRLPV
ncbi:MAG: CoA pyrophosphatase [Desulfuromonas sp.]|uniref:CoA pyrophosphatase n=1 Tax=Desulfuromonas sp. TaxID=892 RepID=UPI000CBA5FE3|nr:CoA pyrophosphatase [Desulfuromonas sp.]PLX84270.1 MAG: CoA pyrophosphatase [Desulfuromonas sp.]